MSEVTIAGRGRGWVRFALHYVEMVVAMFAGMMLFAVIESAVLGLVGLGYTQAEQPVLATAVMTANMSLGMAIWMRIRGHGLPGILEMSAAMFVPLVPLAPLYWMGVVSGESLYELTHMAMLPLMLLAMLLRRAEYSGRH